MTQKAVWWDAGLKRTVRDISLWLAAMILVWNFGRLDPVIYLQGWDLWVLPMAVAIAIFRLAPPPQTRASHYWSFWLALALMILLLRYLFSSFYMGDLSASNAQFETFKRWWVAAATLPAAGIRPFWAWWYQRARTRLGYAILHRWLTIGGGTAAGIVFILAVRNMSLFEYHTWADADLDLATILLNRWILGFVPVMVMGVFLSGLLLVLVIGPGFWLSQSVAGGVTRRLGQLQAAVTFQEQGPPPRVPVDGGDEIAQLKRDFNAMSDKLGKTMDELADAKAQSEALLEEHRRLTATIGHELRTPLAVIEAHLEQAEDVLEGRPEAEHILQVRGDFKQVSHLVEDLFTLSRARAGGLTVRLEQGSPEGVLEETAQQWRDHLWSRFRLTLVIEAETPTQPVSFDPIRLRQVLTNLIHNAARYSQAGGVIMVGLSQETDAWVLEVRDTGQGIATDQLKHIWEPFRTADGDPKSGSGLGLAVVRALVEAMNGGITVTSTLGEGTCFTMRFPI